MEGWSELWIRGVWQTENSGLRCLAALQDAQPFWRYQAWLGPPVTFLPVFRLIHKNSNCPPRANDVLPEQRL
jgi:hypothetical protein